MNTDSHLPTQKKQAPRDKALNFVTNITTRCDKDHGLRARLTRADNPATEYQSWEVLASFQIDLGNDHERIPYATIAAAIARAKAKANGKVQIGQAIAYCYENSNEKTPAKAKLRRLLACESAVEACRILRPLFSLINANTSITLDYASLLNDLLWFSNDNNQLKIKANWAQGFYSEIVDAEEGAQHE